MPHKLSEVKRVKLRMIELLQLNPAVTNFQMSRIFGCDYRTIDKYRKEIEKDIEERKNIIEKQIEIENKTIWNRLTSMLGVK